jgi:hypothetical protein
MGKEEDNSRSGWFLKDDKNRFVNKDCIKAIGINTYQYISYLTFSPECRAYITRIAAEEALLTLNKIIEKVYTGVCFHIECLTANDVISQGREFKGNNMIIQEYTI